MKKQERSPVYEKRDLKEGRRKYKVKTRIRKKKERKEEKGKRYCVGADDLVPLLLLLFCAESLQFRSL